MRWRYNSGRIMFSALFTAVVPRVVAEVVPERGFGLVAPPRRCAIDKNVRPAVEAMAGRSRLNGILMWVGLRFVVNQRRAYLCCVPCDAHQPFH